MEHRLVTTTDGCRLAATLSGPDPRAVLLHPGVADRRVWAEVMTLLAPALPAVAYDRPGFGATPPAAVPFTHVGHLGALLDQAVPVPPLLVGNSQGGRIAIDFTLAHPSRVRGLVLIGTAVSGAPVVPLDGPLATLDSAIDAADAASDLDEVNRLEAHLWLDGPGSAEGRVGGAARERFLEMNRIALRAEGGVPPDEPPSAWERLEEITVPVLVVLGELDADTINVRGRELAERIPGARLVELPGVAHVPALENPETLAALIGEFDANIR